jgi:hypothetical protein
MVVRQQADTATVAVNVYIDARTLANDPIGLIDALGHQQ